MQAPNKQFHSLIAASVAAIFSSSPVWAESPPEAETQLPQVEVVSTSPLPGIGIEKNKLPYDVQSVNEETIYNAQSMNMTEFMSRNLLGVNVNEVQGSPFQADITYRGFRLSGILGSSQGLSVYMDGVRVNEPFGDIVNWDMLPEAAFANVTLVPGSNPVYGLNTLGGALAFTTKSGLTTKGSEVKLQAGSFGRMRADMSYGSKSEDGWHRFIATTVFDESGWRENSAGSLGNVFTKIGRSQNDSNWDLSLLVARSNLLGNGLLPSTNYGEDGSATPTTGMYEANRRWIYTHPDQTKNELHMLTLNLQRMLDSSTELAGMSYFRHGVRQSLNGDVEADTGSAVLNHTTTWQTSYGGSLNLTRLQNNHQTTSGVSFDSSSMRYGTSVADNCELDASRSPIDCDPAAASVGVRGKSYAVGIYATDTWSLNDKTHLTTAARLNHAGVSNTLTGQTKESFTYNSLNPSLGVSHQLNSAVNLFGNLGQSNRVPTVIELGCADPTVGCLLPTGLQSDPYLKQIIARTAEAGIRWKHTDDSGISVAAYRSENRDDILFRSLGAGTQLGYFSNFSRTRRQGIDVSAYSTIGQITLQAGYSYLNATYQAEDVLFGGEREITVKPGTKIAGLPAHTLKLNADWRASPKFTIGGSIITTSSIVTQGNEDGLIGDGTTSTAVNAKVNGYTVLHMHANYEAEKGLDFFARVNNVLNTRFETYGMMGMSAFDSAGTTNLGLTGDATINRFVAPGAPRSIMIGMRYRF